MPVVGPSLRHQRKGTVVIGSGYYEPNTTSFKAPKYL